MLLRAPAHCTGLSHEGRASTIGGDRSVEVEDHLVSFFLACGFTHCLAPNAASPSCDEELDIDTLTRNELFAFLRARGVRVHPPITNAALREIARRALEKEVHEA
jgi:hypothetical protein